MPYGNTLHPSSGSQQNGSSSLVGAVCTSPAGARFASPNRRRIPQAIWVPTTRWRHTVNNPPALSAPILFDIVGYQYQGIPMRELTTRGQAGLDQIIAGARDCVLRHMGSQKITLRIIWPGYEHMDWYRSLDLDVDGPTTRSQLATLIANQIARFMERCRTEPGLNPHWKIGPSGLRFDQTILVGLFHVFADVWQADIAVDFR